MDESYSIMPREISQTKTNTLRFYLYVKSKIKDTGTIKRKLIDTEKRLVVIRGERA